MRKTWICLIVALFAVFAAPTCFAATDRGFYLGAGVGYGNTHYYTLTLQKNFRIVSIHNAGLAPQLVFGYRFYQCFSLGMGVIYFHKLTFGPYDFHSDVTSKNKQNLVYLAGKFNITLYKAFFMSLKAGMGYVARDDTVYKLKIILSEPKQYIVVPVYGLSFGYNITPHWVVELVWIGTASRTEDQLPPSNFYEALTQFAS